MNDIFEKFTNHSQKAIKQAFGLALSLGHKTLYPEHILYGLRQELGSIGAEILNKAKVDTLKLKKIINQKPTKQNKINQIALAPKSKKILEKAVWLALLHKHKYVGTEHLLAATLEINDQKINDFLKQTGVNLTELKRQLNVALSSAAKFSELVGALGSFNQERQNDFLPGEATGLNQSSALDFFATNLTDPKIQANIDPVIGRQEEINRLIEILSRRQKNNPVLLGDPGVGKTAIVEGLAKKIAEGAVPEFLNNKKIYALDLSAVVAGTSFRGDFENRLRQIVLEVKKNPDIILFIDELHNIIGAGSASGSMDAANILKPALARGEIRCIGATTLDDYKKNIESDPALERRFQPIFVNQPSVAETIKILSGIKKYYEIFHRVKINDEAIKAAAELSDRYLTDRFLPDKAIDLIDEAAAAAKISQGTDKQFSQIKILENQLREINQKKEEMVKKENFNLAVIYKKQEEKINEQIRQLKQAQPQTKSKPLAEITSKNITKIIAKITGIPLHTLASEEKKRLLNLEKLLGQKIIGQPEVLKTVAEFIRRSKAGITAANRPIGSFIFLGPSGVGKTELAKIIAQTIFNSPDALIRIDMSEFAESFNISKLIGAPAGYVGYKEGAKLTDAVKRKPYAVVLFDEIEKANPQVFNLFLQILEDGQLTDAIGKKINFKNTIVIMTSNLGSDEFNRQAALGFAAEKNKEKSVTENGFEETQRQILKKLKNKFSPEFLNRLDKIIIFKPLSPGDIVKIADHQLAELKQRLRNQGINVNFSNQIAKIVAKLSYSPESGARAVRKTIQDLIESQIAARVLTNQRSIKIEVKTKENKIILR